MSIRARSTAAWSALGALLLSAVVAPAAVAEEVEPGIAVVNPTEYAGAIKNPLMGMSEKDFFVNTTDPASPEDQTLDYMPWGSLAMTYIPWDHLENDESDSIDKIADYLDQRWRGKDADGVWRSYEEYNIKVIPRLYLRFPAETSGNTGSFYGLGGDHWPDDLADGDFRSAEFDARLERMVQRLAELWDDDPRVAYIQMGVFGTWGEQHGTAEPEHIEQYFSEYFQNKQVQVRYHHTGQWENPDQFGHYNDTIGNRNTADNWATKAIGGEPAYDYAGAVIHGSLVRETYLDEDLTHNTANTIRDTHATYLTWVGDYSYGSRWTADDATGGREAYLENKALIDSRAEVIQRELGYRYVMSEFSYPEQVVPGDPFDVSFTVTNTGSAPMYYDWPVQVSLRDPDTDEVVWADTFEDVHITEWQPGSGFASFNGRKDGNWSNGVLDYETAPEPHTESGTFTVPDTLPTKDYVVQLAVLDPGGDVPSLRFAMENYTEGGYHPMGYVGVNQAPATTEIDPASFDDPGVDVSLRYYTSDEQEQAANALASLELSGDAPLLAIGGTGYDLENLLVAGRDAQGKPHGMDAAAVEWNIATGGSSATLDGSMLSPVDVGFVGVTATYNGVTSEPFTIEVSDDVGNIHGRITTSDGDAVSGVEVAIASGGGGYSATTDGDGAYVIENALSGSYALTAEKEHYVPLEVADVAVAKGETTALDLTMDLDTGGDFFDDFADGAGDWTPGTGSWSAADGRYTQSAGSGSNSWRYQSTISDKIWEDATYEADISYGSGQNWAALLFRKARQSDTINHSGYFVAWNHGGLIELDRAGSSITRLGTAQVDTDWSIPHHLKVVTDGDLIQVYIDHQDTPIIEAEDSTYRYGYAGVGANGSTWSFDDVTITEAEPEEARFVAVQAPDAITGVPNGTEKTAVALGLPEQVVVETTTGTVEADVAWNVEDSSYEPASEAAQQFTVDGLVTLPEAVANPDDLSLATSVDVSVDEAPIPEWDPSLVYLTGDEVQFGGSTWVAQWWTRNQVPGDPYGSWMEIGAEVETSHGMIREWTASWVYLAGDRAVHDGNVWEAKWWTRNQEPGAAKKRDAWHLVGPIDDPAIEGLSTGTVVIAADETSAVRNVGTKTITVEPGSSAASILGELRASDGSDQVRVVLDGAGAERIGTVLEGDRLGVTAENGKATGSYAVAIHDPDAEAADGEYWDAARYDEIDSAVNAGTPTFPQRECVITDDDYADQVREATEVYADGNESGSAADTGSPLVYRERTVWYYGDAINAAIEDCSSAGGGTVRIPAGESENADEAYYSGSINLLSDVNLLIEEDATVKFMRNKTNEYYPVTLTSYEGTDIYNFASFIRALGQENIAVTGGGTLDAQEDMWNWRPWKKGYWGELDVEDRSLDADYGQQGVLTQMNFDDTPVETRIFTDDGSRPATIPVIRDGEVVQIDTPADATVLTSSFRPHFIEPNHSSNILIEGVKLRNAPFWQVHPMNSENVLVRGIDIYSNKTTGYQASGWNNDDGIDPESTTNVVIEDVHVTVSDDGVALKAGRNTNGREHREPTSGVIIRNSEFRNDGGNSAGVSAGSEMSGGIRDVFAHDLIFGGDGLIMGFKLKTNSNRGGGIENWYARDSVFENVNWTIVEFDADYPETVSLEHADAFDPTIRNVWFDRISTSEELLPASRNPQMFRFSSSVSRSPVANVHVRDLVLHSTQNPAAAFNRNKFIADFVVEDAAFVNRSTGAISTYDTTPLDLLDETAVAVPGVEPISITAADASAPGQVHTVPGDVVTITGKVDLADHPDFPEQGQLRVYVDRDTSPIAATIEADGTFTTAPITLDDDQHWYRDRHYVAVNLSHGLDIQTVVYHLQVQRTPVSVAVEPFVGPQMGGSVDVTANFAHEGVAGSAPVEDLVLAPRLPDGWTAEALTDTGVESLDPGETVAATWRVIRSGGAYGTLQLSVEAQFDDPASGLRVTVAGDPFTIDVDAMSIETTDVTVVAPAKLQAVRPVEDGVMPYSDRTYPLASYPEALEGAVLIPGANDDKRVSGGTDYLEFSVEKDSVVYVALDARGRGTWWPEWVAAQGFEETDLRAIVADGSLANMVLFSKGVGAGDSVTLGGNNANTNDAASYFTFVAAYGPTAG
ncbi:DUF4832 domain-containing protein [Agromyces mangrovi Wang et al. 2018]|uniref:DUF4832 domain-containing protein n=1 Tax=Agromyces mangrovi TaxID=1858653 RepID=UPI002573605C|nr:DUF4832 domain-containing protein [Agromyces mangrovi]BDZ64433.1 hypothetical protein GCM10025877_13710 [Agromyces mangrovi]